MINDCSCVIVGHLPTFPNSLSLKYKEITLCIQYFVVYQIFLVHLKKVNIKYKHLKYDDFINLLDFTYEW